MIRARRRKTRLYGNWHVAQGNGPEWPMQTVGMKKEKSPGCKAGGTLFGTTFWCYFLSGKPGAQAAGLLIDMMK
jgi:hypothetical protein